MEEMQNTKTEMVVTSEEKANLICLMEDLLDSYDYDYSKSALEKILNTWAENNADLILHFKKHPNYVPGKFMIGFDTDIERTMDMELVNEFFDWVLRSPVVGLKNDVPEDIKELREKESGYLLPFYMYNAMTYGGVLRTLDVLLTAEQVEIINKVFPFAHAHTGQKANRVVNKIMKYLGYDKHPDYNREYAKYADAMSPMTIKRHTILSINPIDYLTMSFGNSWASCHTIDKTNKRGMPNTYEGQYSSGTMSYMLDGTSMVFYTVDAKYDGDEYYNEPKVHRQMFHFQTPCLIQGRLYPQDNDYKDNDFYKQYRNLVQKIMSEIYEVPNLWSIQRRTSEALEHVISHGTHYQDYVYYDNCTISTLKSGEDSTHFTVVIGHKPICVYCGKEHSNKENISCCAEHKCRCENCGEFIDEDEVRWIDNEPYCNDCAHYCDNCNEYHRNEEHYVASSNEWVCDDCFYNDYSECSCCGEIFSSRDLSEVEGEMICENCWDEKTDTCSECGDVYFIDHMHRLPNGDLVCDDCYDNLKEETEEE